MKRMLDQKQIDQLAELLNGHVPNEKFKELIESLGGTSLKAGYFIWDAETAKLVNVEELPEDYEGFAIFIDYDDDLIQIGQVANQLFNYNLVIEPSQLALYGNGENCVITSNGVRKLDFASLTHSFNELDPTLKTLCETAITSSQPQTCSSAQWQVIKKLLDNSLYFNYDGTSMIKTLVGLDAYRFGVEYTSSTIDIAHCMDIAYDALNEEIAIEVFDL